MSISSRVTLQIICGLWLIFIMVACAATPPADVQPTMETKITATAIVEATSESEVTSTDTLATCADIDTHWGNDWPTTLATLETLIATDQACGEEPLLSKKYAAHYIYAASLEESGDIETATYQYRAALAIDPNRQEALNALFRLDALPDPTPAPCLSTSDPRPDPAPTEPPDPSSFVTVSNDQLILADEVFKVKGVNYYPRHTPWHRFLEESDPAEMAVELDLIKEAGFNTLRVFLWYEPLFTCQPEDAIPNEETFAKVDTLLQLADERDLKLIITLNDLPDLMFRPLYTDWEYYDAQTTYIVRRYRNEPAILAWDLRNEGDIDYGAQSSDNVRFNETEVLKWLAHSSQIVQENDPYHLITAGWWGDPVATDPYVDFLCFHQFDSFDTQQLQARIKGYQTRTDKPLILGEVGYHSWADAAENARDETEQAKILTDVANTTDEQEIAGWIIWTAFDFVIPPGQPPNYEHFFGLWRSDLTPKPVLEMLPLQSSPQTTSTPIPHGQIITVESSAGSHHVYIPTTIAPSPDIVVLVHGTPGKEETALEVARYYLENWITVAEEKGAILIAPAFDQLNFSSKDGEQALGGYRGLFGRHIGADEFVLHLVDTYQTQFGATDSRFYLYGHSAGGQYTARFIVTHPDRIKGAVITAAATYPQPNPGIAWPYGLGELHTNLQWHSPDTETPVEVEPILDDWLTATTLPVTVIVGMNDLEWQPDRTGQKGNNRVVIARNWAQDMNNFAAEHGVTGTIKLSLIPNLGHSSIGLTPYSLAALLP